MAFPTIKGYQLEDQTITRADVNVSTSGKAVIARILEQANSGVKIYSSSGADSGTGDVKLMVDTDYLDTIYLKTESDPTVSSYTKGLTSASVLLTQIKTVDGTGSGLDADLLDGQDSSYYLNYNNIYNTPTIPSTPNLDQVLSVGNISGTNITVGSASVAELDIYNITTAGWLAVDSNGGVTSQSLPLATTSAFGTVKVGSGLSISSGVISNSSPDQTVTINPGTNIAVGGSYPTFTISNNYTLPTASTTLLGGIKVGTGLVINSGVLSTDLNAAIWSITRQSSTYYMNSTDAMVVMSNTSAATVYLPSNPAIGRMVAIVRTTSASLTINCNGNSATYKDSAAQTSFASAWSHWMLWDGVYWRRISDTV